jgi:hypothetical protein
MAGDRTLHLSFSPDEMGDTFEYSLDGGAWHPLAASTDDWGSTTADVTGLTNGTTYAVRVHELNADGAGDPTDAVSGTPAVVPGAPTGVAVTAAPSSFTVTWSAPTSASTFPIAGYEVYVSDELAQNGGQGCPVTDDPNARSCTIQGIPGHDYGVVVVADDDHGNSGAGSTSVMSGKIPGAAAPAAVPAASGTMSSPSGAVSSLAAGQSVTLTGSGYAANSTVDLYVYSTPRKIGTVTTDAEGGFTVTVTVPADLAPGAHHLVAAGVDPSGALRYLRVDVTVTQAAGQLAWTGFEALPFVGAGVLALALGSGLVVVSRRRRVPA